MRPRRLGSKSKKSVFAVLQSWQPFGAPNQGKRQAARLKQIQMGARWLLFLSLLFVLNLYVFYYRPGTSVPSLIQASESQRQEKSFSSPVFSSATGRPTSQAETPKILALDYASIRKIEVDSSHSIEQSLLSARLPKTRRNELLSLLDEHGFSEDSSKVSLVFYFDRMDQCLALDVQSEPRTTLRVMIHRFHPTSFFSVQTLEGEPSTKIETIHGMIPEGGSLVSAIPLGESNALLTMLIDVFAYERDLQTLAKVGDSFQIVIEKIYQGDRFVRYGTLLYAKYQSNQSETPLSAVWFQGRYYSEKGRSLTRAFYRSPLVLGLKAPKTWGKDLVPEWRPQKKRMDSFASYPAPPRTPVRAIFAGRLTLCSKEEHCAFVLTSKENEARYQPSVVFAPGIRVGQNVMAGQVIGFTAPSLLSKKTELRISLLHAKKVVNPISGYSEREDPVPAELMSNFQQETQNMLAKGSQQPSLKSRVASWIFGP